MQTIDGSPSNQTGTLPGLKPCAHCTGVARLVEALQPTRYGVQCSVCNIGFSPLHKTPDLAAAVWNRRKNGVSVAGGKATKGKLSWRKRRSCRRNLSIARRNKKLKWIRANVECAAMQLKKYREVERARTEAALAEDLAWLKQRESLIHADPGLQSLYELLTKRIE